VTYKNVEGDQATTVIEHFNKSSSGFEVVDVTLGLAETWAVKDEKELVPHNLSDLCIKFHNIVIPHHCINFELSTRNTFAKLLNSALTFSRWRLTRSRK
jgi:nucleosome binding factor SPN SPT16 subunit